MKTPKKNVNRKQIKLDKLDSFDLGMIRRIIHNRLYLKNGSRDFSRAHGFSIQKRKLSPAFNKDGVQDVEKFTYT